MENKWIKLIFVLVGILGAMIIGSIFFFIFIIYVILRLLNWIGA